MQISTLFIVILKKISYRLCSCMVFHLKIFLWIFQRIEFYLLSCFHRCFHNKHSYQIANLTNLVVSIIKKCALNLLHPVYTSQKTKLIWKQICLGYKQNFDCQLNTQILKRRVDKIQNLKLHYCICVQLHTHKHQRTICCFVVFAIMLQV